MRERRPRLDRRAFLRRAAGAAALSLGARPVLAQGPGPSPGTSHRTLAQRFPDLRHHFIFEYYPWYGGPPDYEHWEYLDRRPPFDLGATYVPRPIAPTTR